MTRRPAGPRPSFLDPLSPPRSAPLRLKNLRTGETIADEIETAFSSQTRRRGLMGREAMEAGAALVIAPCQAIHTFNMRFPIDVLFVARDGRVVKVRHAVPARRMSGALGAYAVIELPAGTLARAITRPGDGLAFTADSR